VVPTHFNPNERVLFYLEYALTNGDKDSNFALLCKVEDALFKRETISDPNDPEGPDKQAVVSDAILSICARAGMEQQVAELQEELEIEKEKIERMKQTNCRIMRRLVSLGVPTETIIELILSDEDQDEEPDEGRGVTPPIYEEPPRYQP